MGVRLMTATCRHCHCPLPPDSPAGICPACFLRLARQETGPDSGGRWHPKSVEQLQGMIPGVQLISLIGCGGMGAVYRALQTDLQRPVAVKVMPESLSADPTFVERFRREAQTLGKLNHPNIVSVYDSGVSNGVCYIVMELVEGTTLREAIAASAIDPAAALRIVPKICDALAYAHDRGIVHRDIKPENILLGTGGVVKMVDFGLAKITADEDPDMMLTHTGARLGTLRYMSPEQLDGTSVDHRTDIYSLGVVLYEMLTGRVPAGRFPLPSETSDVDPRIDAVVMRTLCHDPNQRYQRADEIPTELSAISSTGFRAQTGWRRGGQGMHGGWGPTAAPWGYIGRQWRSRSTFRGWPLVHVAYGYDPATGEKLVARGVIAVGDVAVGGLAVGGVSLGVVSIGGVACGLNALGGVAIALQTGVGGCAMGALAIGGAALGLLALGGAAIGGIAAGGAAVGHVAIGGAASGRYTVGRGGRLSPETFADNELASLLADQWMPYYATAGLTLSLIGPLALIALVVVISYFYARATTVRPARKVPGVIKVEVGRVFLAVCLMCLLVPTLAFFQLRTVSRTVSRAKAEIVEARQRAEAAAALQHMLQQQEEIER